MCTTTLSGLKLVQRRLDRPVLLALQVITQLRQDQLVRKVGLVQLAQPVRLDHKVLHRK